MRDTPVICTIAYDRPGRQAGRLQIPRSLNDSGWSQLYVPVVCIANGRGPTVLVTGGVHGDEPEGQIAALNLARETRVEDVRGRLLIMPCLSPEASLAYTRLWPDGANLNRSFPGSPDGPPDALLADYLTRVVFPMCDAVCDIHSGGRSMLCLPWSEVHLVDDGNQRAAMIEAMLAWNTDYHFAYIDIAGGGLLVGEAERQGKIAVGTELGGGGHVTAGTHRLAARGLRNFLRHTGVLAGALETRASLGLPPPTFLKALDVGDYVLAPESGLFEAVADLGAPVAAGQVLGRLHFIERPDRPPVEITAAGAGTLCTVRSIAPTRQGDCVAVIGHPCRREDLIA